MLLKRSLLAAAAASLASLSTLAAPPARHAPQVDPLTGARTFQLWDGSTATVSADGMVVKKARSGRTLQTQLPASQGDLGLLRSLSLPARGLSAPRVLLSTDGRLPVAGNQTLAASVRAARPLPQGAPNAFVVEAGDPAAAARALRSMPGVVSARPDYYASSMALDPRPLAPEHTARLAAQAAAPRDGLPTNFGLQSSLQAHLNSTGVAAAGAFAILGRRFGQLPGQGVRVTNVSVGDLTDQAMADAGDDYVRYFGPTTRLIGKQRYLDYPSLPLIPTFVVDPDGSIDPVGTVEGVDPYLSEILLDFSVMAPLPHELQRQGAEGDGLTDLLGIAPGAEYRLVVPREPTISNIFTAMLAAAQQQPRPDVITASLGFGFDSVGFAGRYLEDDAVGQAAIASIVRMGIVVCISSNDGTRLFTPAAVNSEGGSVATELVRAGERPTSVDDDAFSTTPTRVADSFAIAVGGTTLDDILSAPPHAGGPLASVGQFPETRFNGGTGFSSGFGGRVNLSAPSDGIVALVHLCQSEPCSPQDSIPVLSGGTSASAPMVAAAAAVVIQVARLTHQPLTPRQVRELLIRTGRPLSQTPQADRPLELGPQLDVTAAVEELLSRARRDGDRDGRHADDDRRGDDDAVSILRLAVAHRRELGSLGAAFREDTDRAAIDLAGSPDFGLEGQWAVGPITFAPDLVGRPAGDRVRYALRLGQTEFVQSTPAFRLLPAQILSAAGLPFVSDQPRAVTVRYEVRDGSRALAAIETRLVFGPTDGTHAEALAPIAPATAEVGDDVTVHYDLSAVRNLNKPALIVSGIGHFSPTAAPLFHAAATFPLERLTGHVRIPASAFRGGAGLYGIGVVSDTDQNTYGHFATIRIAAGSSTRPDAPLIADASGVFGHAASLAIGASSFQLRWEAPAGDGALLEASAPAPTLRNALNTFANQGGSQRDANGTDSASTALVALPSSSGTKRFDAAALGLSPGMFYNLRIFATRHGKIVGQASPSVGVSFDAVATPGAAQLVSFDFAGDSSTATLAQADDFGNLSRSSLVRFAPAAAAFGATLENDPNGDTAYEVIGTDAALGRTLVLRNAWASPTQWVETWDVKAGKRISALPLDLFNDAFLLAARVDRQHHRAGLLAFGPDFLPFILPVDLATGALGAPVLLPDGLYNNFEFEPRTGKVFAAFTGADESCVVRRVPLAQLDLDTGESITAPIASCATGLAADGRALRFTNGPLVANRTLLPQARAQRVDEETLEAEAPVTLEGRSPLFPAVDPVHRLLFVAFVASADFPFNSNATSAIAAYSLDTGKRVFYSTAFNFARAAFGNPYTDTMALRGIQLDPKTRTGWTFGPDSRQLQPFSY